MKKTLEIIRWNTVQLITAYVFGALPLVLGYKVIQTFGFWSIPTVLVSTLITYYFNKVVKLIF